jgi:hypothetical protein
MRTKLRSLARWALLVASVGLSCKSGPPLRTDVAPRRDSARPKPSPKTGPAMLPAQVLAQLDDDAGALLARRGDEGLLFYTAGGKHWTRAFKADGAPKGPATDVGPAPGEASALGGLKATPDGYLAVWVEIVSRNKAVKVLALDPAGKPRGEPATVMQSADELRWVDVVAGAKTAWVLWEIPRGDTKEVTMQQIAAGKPVGAPLPAVRGAVGWEMIATSRGFAIATVMPEAPAPTPRAKPAGKAKAQAEASDTTEDTGTGRNGRVVLTELDANGKASAPITVSAGASAQFDVRVGEIGGRYLLAWTDERDLDPCVYVASIEPGGKVASAPRRATSPFGEQALVSLIAPPFDPLGGARAKYGLLAWEDLLRAPHDTRLIHLATIKPDGSLNGERAILALAASGPPDIVTDGEGFAATTLAPFPDAYEKIQPPRPAKGAAHDERGGSEIPIWPAFVRFGKDLEVRGGEPVRAEPFVSNEGVPYVTRSLSCAGSSCFTLASGSGAGAPVALVSLPARSSPWRASGWRAANDAPPRTAFLGAIHSGEHVSKVAAVELADGSKIAGWVTHFVEAARGKGRKDREDGNAARLEVRAIDKGPPSLTLAKKPVLISQKAVSIGGIAMASAPAEGKKTQETVLAWVAKERGEPQVFVAKLAADGSKTAQKSVTTIARKKDDKPGSVPSEASDVAVAYDGSDGFVVAWVDSRDGNGEVYVAKIDRSLNKVIPDRRITEAPGDAADVQILVRGKDTFLAWSDIRKANDDENADIYLARLESGSLKKLGPEARLFASAAHSRSPSFVVAPKTVLLTWIEEAPEDKTIRAPETGLRIAQLDVRGALVGTPALVRSEQGALTTSAALSCGKLPCRGVLTSAVGEALVLSAFELNPGAGPRVLKNIGSLTGSITQDVSPVFTGEADSLFFADDALGGQGRVRWMHIAWP